MLDKVGVRVGLGVAAMGLAALAGAVFIKNSTKTSSHHEYLTTAALIGDVGGTNIRLQLVTIKPPSDQPQKLIKAETLSVEDFPTFQSAIEKFLSDTHVHPNIAVIAIAGPIMQNTVAMANVPKWGRIRGDQLGRNLNINHVKLINDFQAISYGILLLPPDEFVSINNLPVDVTKSRGIIGPGTGLGNSILYSTPFRHRQRTYVLASQGGHTDFPYIDEECAEFFKFLRKNLNIAYISLERSFCGPAIPLMYQFYAQKDPEGGKEKEQPPTLRPEYIIEQCISQNPAPIFKSVFGLFIKIYSAAIGNFISHHMCTGGMYLVGSITNSILPLIKNKDILADFRERHADLAETTVKVPIIVCKQIDLGLKGAFYMARRIISDQQHD